MNDFMKGRNGADELTIVMGFSGIVIAMIGSMARIQWLSWIAIAVIVIGVLRGLSKNIDARRKENAAFVAAANASRAAGTSKEDFERAKRTAKKMWKGRKTTAYLKCPNCGQMLSVPKGKGKIRVTCPKCHAKMETRS